MGQQTRAVSPMRYGGGAKVSAEERNAENQAKRKAEWETENMVAARKGRELSLWFAYGKRYGTTPARPRVFFADGSWATRDDQARWDVIADTGANATEYLMERVGWMEVMEHMQKVGLRDRLTGESSGPGN